MGNVTEEQVSGLGWNTIVQGTPESPNMNVLSEQLKLIGLLLLEIRDAIEAEGE